MNVKLLNKLYTTHSPSRKEDAMAELIANELCEMKIPFEQDKYLQIHRIIEGKPLMVAHMDQVQSKACSKVMSFKNKIYGFDSKGKLSGLGADDKNGIYVILQMIKQFRDDLSFIFSANEEGGGYLRFLTAKLDLDTTPYALVFDRKGSSDIIGTGNGYCCDDLEVAIQTFSGKMKYKPAHGIFSDCDELSDHVPCVNLSVGYYDAHTVDEYCKPAELFRAVQLAETLISNLPRKSSPFEKADKWEALPDDWDWRSKWGYDKWDDYLDYNPATPKPKGKKKDKTKVNGNITKVTSAFSAPDPSVFYDDSGVYFFDEDQNEHFMGESASEAVGEWVLDNNNSLLIDRIIDPITKELKLIAKHNGKSIDVEIYDIDQQEVIKV